MKRSSIITLLVLGAGGVFLYSLAGEKRSEDMPEGGKAYKSLAECEAGGDVTKADCAKGWDDALTAHEKTAPTFTSLAACETEYGAGKCGTPRNSTAGSYIPTMAAIMIGSMWLSRGYGAAPMVCRPYDPSCRPGLTGGRYAGAPASSGGWWGGSRGSSTSSRSTSTSSSTSSTPSSSGPSSSTSTTSRGGFGSTGGGYASGG